MPATPTPLSIVSAKTRPGFEWLTQGGEMSARIRELDWAQTPIGPVETWSPALRMMVQFLLANRFPLLLWWGPHYISIYNDAYRPILGAKHPRGLGQPVSECWSEIWHVLRPLIDTPYQGGPATWNDDILLEINRHGFVEETHFTIAYSPVPDESVPGGIGGVLATAHETTDKIVAERRIGALRDLGARTGQGKSGEEACAIAAETLARHAKDVPFALFYLMSEDGTRARLAGAAGVPMGADVSPRTIHVQSDTGAWDLGESLRDGALHTVPRLQDRFKDVPAGPWSDAPTAAAVVNIPSNKPHHPVGVMIVGLSARLKFDDHYRDFLELVRTQVATAIANARIFEEESGHLELARVRQRAEATLRESEERFRAFVTTTAAVVYRMSADWSEMRHLVGKDFIADTPDPSRSWLQKYIHPDDQARVLAAIQESIRGKTTFALEHRVIRVDGTLGWTFSRAIPRLDAEGRIIEWFGAATDITERKRTEQALRDSEARHRTLFQSMDEGFCVIEFFDGPHGPLSDYVHVQANPAYERHAGIPNVVGQTVRQLVPGEADGWVELYRKVLITGEPIRFERELVATGRHLELAAFRVAPESLRQVAVIFQDVTPRKKAEQELRKSRERFDIVKESTQVGFWFCDLPFDKLEWDHRVKAHFWLPPDAEITIEKFYDRIHPDDREPTRRAIELSLVSKMPYETEYRTVSPDGQVKWIRAIGRGFYDEGGQPQRFDGLTLDITASKLVDEALREGRERLQAALNGSGAGTFRWNIQTNALEWDENLDRLFGLPPGQTIRSLEKFIAVVHPDERPGVIERCTRCAREGADFDMEFRVIWPDGSIRWLDDQGTTYRDEAGRPLYMTGMCIDITERKRVDAALREAHALLADKATHLEELVQQRTAKLRETIGELEAFSYSIAHDMRAPLRSLHGFSDVLLSDYAEKLDAEGRSYLQRISKSAARMDKLIQDVLSYSRVVRGEWPFEPVDVEQLLRGIADTYPMLAPEKADIVLEGAFPRVLGSEAMLMQIFSNLLGNAVKFVPAGRKPHIRVWAESRGERVRLFVRDNGIGIAPEEHEKIFGIFHQVAKNNQGTGIGLAIVKKAVERMNGKVGVESQLGEGTTFWIDIQRA